MKSREMVGVNEYLEKIKLKYMESIHLTRLVGKCQGILDMLDD